VTIWLQLVTTSRLFSFLFTVALLRSSTIKSNTAIWVINSPREFVSWFIYKKNKGNLTFLAKFIYNTLIHVFEWQSCVKAASGAYEIYVQPFLISNRIISYCNTLIITNKLNHSIFKTLNYIQKFLALSSWINRSIISRLGQVHMNSPGPFC